MPSAPGGDGALPRRCQARTARRSSNRSCAGSTGWNREDVSRTYDFERDAYVPVLAAERDRALRALRRVGARVGLLTATDHVADGDGPAAREATAAACAAGALSHVSDIGLRRVPRPPPAR